MALSSALRAFSLLCLLHFGLPGAPQPHRPAPPLNPADRALDEGKRLRNSGKVPEALHVFENAAQAAHHAGNTRAEADALREASGCQILLFQYRAALQSALASERLALKINDATLAGATAINLSTIYRQVGDFASSRKEAEDALRLLSRSERPDFLAKAWLSLAAFNIQQGNVTAGGEQAMRAVSIARQRGLTALEGFAWDVSGISFLLAGNLSRADNALRNAFEIRDRIHDNDGLAVTNEHFAELELKRADYPRALSYIDKAFASPSASFKANPQYYPIHVRGLILLGLGRKREALAEFRRAIASATRWREGALPADATSTQTVAYLDEVYRDYSQLGATLAIEEHDPVLARRAFEALAENRAASLREQMILAFSRNFRLPQEYFQLLSDLQSAQAKATFGEKPGENQAEVARIRIQLSDLENKIGLESPNPVERPEKNSGRNSLTNIQERLSDNEVLLSFSLGAAKSFLWAVSEDRVNLYELPPESDIREHANKFSAAVQTGQNPYQPGAALAQDLFGKLDRSFLQKHDWLITTDGVLLDRIPFSALPLARTKTPIVTGHALRFLPSELLLTFKDSPKPDPAFLGVGDPIYNTADPRNQKLKLVKTGQTKTSFALARLPASEREIRSAAQASGMRQIELLTGTRASAAGIADALSRKPEVLHFAVHVVSPAASSDKDARQPALALSLTPDGMPELLTPEEISTLRVPGSLVILSGCSSAAGEILPSAGLIGLSRAWLLAGASAVIVSAWPTPDDSGHFFSAFYNHFRLAPSGSLAKRAALALAQAQCDMQRGGGYRSSPSFWAAYSIVSKE